MRYKFLDIPSDVMFEAYGKSFEELLENSAIAMFSVICSLDKVKEKNTVNIKTTAKTREHLLNSWLSELLTQSEIREMFFSAFKIVKIDETNGNIILHGIASGEEMSIEKGGTLVKGVTYYNIGIEKTDKGYKTTVTLDI